MGRSSVALVSPGKSDPFRRHWNRRGAAPEAETENVAVAPLVTIRFCGWETMKGGASTVATTDELLFAGFKSSSTAVAVLALVTCPAPVGATTTETTVAEPVGGN